jgi:hypothetical protein
MLKGRFQKYRRTSSQREPPEESCTRREPHPKRAARQGSHTPRERSSTTKGRKNTTQEHARSCGRCTQRKRRGKPTASASTCRRLAWKLVKRCRSAQYLALVAQKGEPVLNPFVLLPQPEGCACRPHRVVDRACSTGSQGIGRACSTASVRTCRICWTYYGLENNWPREILRNLLASENLWRFLEICIFLTSCSPIRSLQKKGRCD